MTALPDFQTTVTLEVAVVKLEVLPISPGSSEVAHEAVVDSLRSGPVSLILVLWTGRSVVTQLNLAAEKLTSTVSVAATACDEIPQRQVVTSEAGVVVGEEVRIRSTTKPNCDISGILNKILKK